MKTDRLISIIMVLLERKRVTIPELARICEVTTRTIQRDLDAINQAGVPIVSYPGVGGGVGIMENYKLEKRLFTTSDVTTLLMGLGSIRSSLSGNEAVVALAKVKGMIPEEQRESIELKARRVTIDTSAWMGRRDFNELVDLLERAMEKSRLVRFSYIDGKMNKTVRQVEPYRLILKTMSWYFEGFCLERQDFRIFKLSRMSETVLTDKQFQLRPFTPNQTIQPVFQDMQDAPVAVLRIKEGAIDSMIDDFGQECIEKESEDTWIAKIPVLDDERGYRFLLKYGIDCECLGPESLRAHFQEYIKKLYDIYDGFCSGLM